MNRAALFFDIDGTVLSEITKEIPASTVDALKRAHDAGHFLFINTGRTYCSVPVELKKLPFDGYLCGCGIYFTFDEEIIFEKHLDPERGDEIADYMTKCQIDDKIFIYTDEKSDVKAFFEFIKDDMEVIDRGSNTFECILKGYTKGTAIDWVLEHFGMTRDQSYAFGDSSNDLAMFRHAGHAIAMGAHDQVLEPYTEFVTKTVEEDGIAYAMKKYGLID